MTVEQHIPIGNPICKLPKDLGESNCNGKKAKGGGIKVKNDKEIF